MPYRYAHIMLLALALLPAPATAEADDPDKAKQLCIDYQNELVALETPALRSRISQDPQKIAAQLDSAEITKIRRLIELDELLMFRCRIGLKPLGAPRNPNGRTPLQQAVAIPELPVRRPKFVSSRVSPRVIVPLPTRRSDAK